MFKKSKKLWGAVILGFIAAFFIAKGDKLTSSIAALTTFLGAFSVSDLGIIAGIVLGIITYITNLYFKWANHKALMKNLNSVNAVGAILNEDDR